MGKSLPSATRLRQLAGVVRSQSAARTLKSARAAPGGDRRSGSRRAAMEVETSGEKEGSGRVPLSEVVSDCVKRWFKDSLKEAKAGDVNMQVLVGQMYYSGYGVPRDAQKPWNYKMPYGAVTIVELNLASGQRQFLMFGNQLMHTGRIWMSRASRVRSSVWKVSDKRPGYNASDSDSDEIKDNSEGPKLS